MNETESIFTQLVFEHALRIRLKTDALDEKSKDGGKTTKGNSGKSTGAATPSSVQEGSSSSADDASRGSDSSSETLVDSSEPATEGGHAQAKAGHLVGKINNLITSDLQTINNSYLAITIREYFAIACMVYPHKVNRVSAAGIIQAIVSVWFLYQVLGWRSDSSSKHLPYCN